jgi:Zn-dependent peptidase ImmA (M78 family)
MLIMTIKEICDKAESVARDYNPDNLAPFPYDEISARNLDLKIYLTDLQENISGAIRFNIENNLFDILINNSKSPTRQNFSVAHELGHYFLHKDTIISEQALVDGEPYLDGSHILYRLDEAQATQIEREANNFAATLLMPEALVKKAWDALKNIEDCAKIFKVSSAAMSIRLERLKLTT